MTWPPPGAALPECGRLHNWLAAQDTRQVCVPDSRASSEYSLAADPIAHTFDTGLVEGRNSALRKHAHNLIKSVRPLIWIESADVSATRAAIQLTEACRGTAHVADSPGAANVAAVLSSCGTLGTSLAEVASHADLVLHVGHRHLKELPRLAPRFFNARTSTSNAKAVQHILIGDGPLDDWRSIAQMYGQADGSANSIHLPWSRHHWLEMLTQVLLVARGDQVPTNRPIDAIDPMVVQLAEALAASRYAVILWDQDEFADELDRLLVERLLEIAQHFSETTRCSLLPLGNDPGRSTAHETLLWLTNFAGTTQFADSHWSNARHSLTATLDDWQAEYDWILCLRNLPSDRPLPDLRFDLLIDATCNLPTQRANDSIIDIAAVGLDCAGHLQRVDHAFSAYLRAASPTAQSTAITQPTAAQVLKQLTNEVLQARGPA